MWCCWPAREDRRPPLPLVWTTAGRWPASLSRENGDGCVCFVCARVVSTTAKKEGNPRKSRKGVCGCVCVFSKTSKEVLHGLSSGCRGSADPPAIGTYCEWFGKLVSSSRKTRPGACVRSPSPTHHPHPQLFTHDKHIQTIHQLTGCIVVRFGWRWQRLLLLRLRSSPALLCLLLVLVLAPRLGDGLPLDRPYQPLDLVVSIPMLLSR